MKKALSLVLALTMVMSAFALNFGASADGSVDVKVFDATFGGRSGLQTGVWGEYVNLKVGDQKYTLNALGAATSADDEIGIDALIKNDDQGNLVISSQGNSVSMIQAELWADASVTNQELWTNALAEIEAANGSLATDGLSVKYTVANRGTGVIMFKPTIAVPMDGAAVELSYNGQKEFGNFEYIWPGETFTFEYALPAGKTFTNSEDKTVNSCGVALNPRIVNASSYNSLKDSIDVVVSDVKICTTTANVIKEDNAPEAYKGDPQVDSEKPNRPYRQAAALAGNKVFTDWSENAPSFVKTEGWNSNTVKLDDISSAMTIDKNGYSIDTTGLEYNAQIIQAEFPIDKAKAAAAIETAKAENDGKLQFRITVYAAKAGKYEKDEATGEKVANFYDTNMKFKVYCFANGDWQNAVNLCKETEVHWLDTVDEEGNVVEKAKGYVDFEFDVKKLYDMVPDTVAINAMNQYYDDNLTYAKFNVSPITAGEPEPEGMNGDANGDGKITVADAKKIVVAIAKGATDSLTNADVNKDGKVTVADAKKIVVAIAKGTTDQL